jgi:hypothetical protein
MSDPAEESVAQVVSEGRRVDDTRDVRPLMYWLVNY